MGKSKKEERDRVGGYTVEQGKNDRRIGEKREIEERKEGEDLEEKAVKNEVSRREEKGVKLKG